MKRLVAAIVILVGCSAGVKALEAPTSEPSTQNPKTTITRVRKAPRPQSEAPNTTTTTLPIPADAFCPQWWTLARKVGWPEAELEQLDFVIWRESRCLPDAFNGADAGLLQINQIHREFVAVMGYQWPEGMFEPEAVLTFGLKLWSGKGWEPWGF